MSSIAIIVAIIAIIISAPRAYDLSFDYYGVIIGVLSLLVTALLGWNIYALIDFNRARQEVADLRRMYNEIITNNNTLVHHAVGDVFQTMAFNGKIRSYLEFYIYYRVLELFYVSRTGQIPMCNVLCKELIDVMANPRLIQVSLGLKKEMLLSLAEVQNTRSIEGYATLVQKVSDLSIRPDSKSVVYGNAAARL